MTEETIAKAYTSLVFRGKVRVAVRFVTQRGEGGVLKLDDNDVKSKDKVVDVLHKKHPPAIMVIENLENYDELLEFVLFNIIVDTVDQVARKLSGVAGPGVGSQRGRAAVMTTALRHINPKSAHCRRVVNQLDG